MLKNNMLESLQEVQEILRCNEFKKLTDKQKDSLNNNCDFEYCEDGSYIFLMSENMFENFEYYLGMKQERDNINIKINLDGYVLVTYDYDSNRAKELFNLLKENEEE